jgi:hypothetical protein
VAYGILFNGFASLFGTLRNMADYCLGGAPNAQ